jgi:pimeloyl-ACP methyl ester carboxylesterase
MTEHMTVLRDETITIPVDGSAVVGDLVVPDHAHGLVIFAHGSGSSRFSSRNRAVAAGLQHGGMGTLLLDLLTAAEERVDVVTRQYRFDIERLAVRLVSATDWARTQPDLRDLPIGYFGASTGAAAALIAAARRPDEVAAVVSRGGRPDLAGEALRGVRAPTLLIVGGNDEVVLELNRAAQRQLGRLGVVEIVPGATHLLEEPGALEEVTRLAADWFGSHLRPAPTFHDGGA